MDYPRLFQIRNLESLNQNVLFELCQFALHYTSALESHFIGQGHDLNSETPLDLIHLTFRILRKEFGYIPMISAYIFYSSTNYIEKKVDILLELLHCCHDLSHSLRTARSERSPQIRRIAFSAEQSPNIMDRKEDESHIDTPNSQQEMAILSILTPPLPESVADQPNAKDPGTILPDDISQQLDHDFQDRLQKLHNQKHKPKGPSVIDRLYQPPPPRQTHPAVPPLRLEDPQSKQRLSVVPKSTTSLIHDPSNEKRVEWRKETPESLAAVETVKNAVHQESTILEEEEQKIVTRKKSRESFDRRMMLGLDAKAMRLMKSSPDTSPSDPSPPDTHPPDNQQMQPSQSHTEHSEEQPPKQLKRPATSKRRPVTPTKSIPKPISHLQPTITNKPSSPKPTPPSLFQQKRPPLHFAPRQRLIDPSSPLSSFFPHLQQSTPTHVVYRTIQQWFHNSLFTPQPKVRHTSPLTDPISNGTFLCRLVSLCVYAEERMIQRKLKEETKERLTVKREPPTQFFVSAHSFNVLAKTPTPGMVPLTLSNPDPIPSYPFPFFQNRFPLFEEPASLVECRRNFISPLEWLAQRRLIDESILECLTERIVSGKEDAFWELVRIVKQVFGDEMEDIARKNWGLPQKEPKEEKIKYDFNRVVKFDTTLKRISDEIPRSCLQTPTTNNKHPSIPQPTIPHVTQVKPLTTPSLRPRTPSTRPATPSTPSLVESPNNQDAISQTLISYSEADKHRLELSLLCWLSELDIISPKRIRSYAQFVVTFSSGVILCDLTAKILNVTINGVNRKPKTTQTKRLNVEKALQQFRRQDEMEPTFLGLGARIVEGNRDAVTSLLESIRRFHDTFINPNSHVQPVRPPLHLTLALDGEKENKNTSAPNQTIPSNPTDFSKPYLGRKFDEKKAEQMWMKEDKAAFSQTIR
ncbi:hypothetical protein BLNAU_876 [Blattamonas nauphoetae]|uniref:Calponin-homology (CH) domain-containing protein n=1 Tax=Blattamonas nauphoetae TaxID=2049346 RepID=A0ABQ9YKR6_9EUKA|nr:hypothetical protein BLNAU_876 [Blattamonas nauphoetae]